MNGLWKEKLSGWNYKGDKRKKQKRRHIFKDKAKGIASRHGSKFDHSSRFRNKTQTDFCFYENFVDETFYLTGIYGIVFKSHREWITVYPETQGLRKSYQKEAHRKTRAKVRDWISKKDYNQNTEIRTHSSEKSISYDIH